MRKRKYGPDPIPLFERFIDKINKSDGCWEWNSAFHHKGRPLIHVQGRRNQTAHRISYELAYGPFDKSFFVCHKCDNVKCVRPTHLFLGSAKDNVQDMIKKGRNAPVLRGEHSRLAKLTNGQVREIRRMIDRRVIQTRIAKEFKISPALVSLIRHKKVWSHI